MKKTIVLIALIVLNLEVNAQTLTEKQRQNARATGYSIIASRNPNVDFSVIVIPWDGINTLEENANTQINPSWHAQAAIKGNYYYQSFDGSDFSRYSTVVLSQERFDQYKNTGTQWWIACSTLPPFSEKTNFNGNVGIGTTNPDYKLEISSKTGGVGVKKLQKWGLLAEESKYNLMYDQVITSGIVKHRFSTTNNGIVYSDNLVLDRGKVGIGTTNPDYKLEISSRTGGVGVKKLQKWGLLAEESKYNLMYDQVITSGIVKHRFSTTNNGIVYNDNLVLDRGKVGIGTTNPQTELAVNGTITSKEVVVTTDGWSDFVFNENFKLRKLEEVENYIEENNHLPDIPSEKEVIENGIQVGKMNARLLQKIEELTLYVIDINKEVKTLKDENELLKKEISTLKTQ